MCLFKKKKSASPKFQYNLNFDYSGASFKEALLSGHVTENDISDYIAYYNAHEKELNVPIAEFLGMSDNQYVEWILGSPVDLVQLLKTDY